MLNNESPYAGREVAEWSEVTNRLIAEHPLSLEEILDIAITSWDSVWSTQIGRAPAQIPFRDVNPPATVVGYFFEKIFARELSERYPLIWRGTIGGDEKDLHCISDRHFSTEIKASGQLGTKIFGNRSYGQVVENETLAKKDKSGYYITVNFYGDRLTLIRFGWIDATDWKAQKAATGQMAALDENVYRHKLVPLKGTYTLSAPIDLLHGVGKKLAEECRTHQILTIQDILDLGTHVPAALKKVATAAQNYKTNYSA